ncbi:hypothetical protein LZZ85_03215 [Terrimonas sp. NA20]|uniref:Uncharacterized protein n=1 Tax=Terrimonas ginsenosidimutans TaxID=2908004 RepID=A0ABS9KLR5_9BACT|nr:hypothetical protein [Terrimonas ginsenosidimutans]MCG2613268.1 hypothetical protein [Terrimonas ginsenosidimutans]
MATFVTRIQLEEGTSADYQLLSSLLKKKAFIVLLKEKGGAKNRNERDRTFVTQGTISNITQTVLSAARKTGRTFSFTVIKQKSWH